MKSIPQHTLDYIDSWLTFQSNFQQLPGFTVAIAKDGKILFNKSYGFEDVKALRELVPETPFRIASHSKTFTATSLLQLQEAGKLRIDDPIVSYLDWLNNHKDKRWQHVTIRQLLSHGAGVIRDGLDANFWQLGRAFPDAKQLRAEILEAELVYDNNTKFKYSNFGYSLLGVLIEEVSGEGYAEYVKKHIVEPLNLKNTGPEPDAAVSERLARAYGRLNPDRSRELIPDVDTGAMASATGFYSTAADMCTYFSAHMPGTGKLLNDESKKEMRRVQWEVENSDTKDEYGLGLEISTIGKRKMYGHGGGFPGHSTNSMFDPEDGLVVIVLTNCMNGGPESIGKGVVSVIDYLGDTEPEKALVKFEGRFANLWGVSDTVVSGDQLVQAYPTGKEPFNGAAELEFVSETKLRYKKINGYYSNGEDINYKFDKNGKVIKIVDGGMICIPSQNGVYRLDNNE